MTPKEDVKKALDGLAQFIIMNDTGTDESASAIEWHGILKQSLTELDELKNWQEELIKTIEDLISKGKHWKEKENKTEFEKGISRGYTTMLHQLLIGIDFDEEVVE